MSGLFNQGSVSGTLRYMETTVASFKDYLCELSSLNS